MTYLRCEMLFEQTLPRVGFRGIWKAHGQVGAVSPEAKRKTAMLLNGGMTDDAACAAVSRVLAQYALLLRKTGYRNWWHRFKCRYGEPDARKLETELRCVEQHARQVVYATPANRTALRIISIKQPGDNRQKEQVTESAEKQISELADSAKKRPDADSVRLYRIQGGARVPGFLFTCLSCAWLLAGCQSQEVQRVSSDAGQFRALVTLDTQVGELTWELFSTPEYRGGVPGPADYQTLVAETAAPIELPPGPRPGPVWIAPESARTWLNPAFRAMLSVLANRTIEPSAFDQCRTLKATRVGSGTQLQGMLCRRDGKTLIYLPLAGPVER